MTDFPEVPGKAFFSCKCPPPPPPPLSLSLFLQVRRKPSPFCMTHPQGIIGYSSFQEPLRAARKDICQHVLNGISSTEIKEARE